MAKKKIKNELVHKCLAVGSTAGIIPFLKDWKHEDLRQLLTQLDEYCDEECLRISAVWSNHAFQPANFLNSSLSKQLDAARDSACLNVIAICSEINSVAEFWLAEAGK